MEEGCLDVHPGDIGLIPPGKTVPYAIYGTASLREGGLYPFTFRV